MKTVQASDTARPLHSLDYHKGYLELLSHLTTVGKISESQFKERCDLITQKPKDYAIFVIEDQEGQQILATATLLIEYKFIHECGKIGHIEDVVVHPQARGQGLGLRIVDTLISRAKSEGCYKVILDCGEQNVAFYQKLDMERKEVQMVKYF